MMRTPLLLLLTLAAACKSNPHAAEQAPPAPTPVAAGSGSGSGSSAGSAVLPDPTGAPGTQDLVGMSNVLNEVQRESKDRPVVKITAEKVRDALDAKGIKFNSWKQVLAHNVGANYCASGKIIDAKGGEKGVVVCEYATPEVAKAAVAELTKNPPFPDAVTQRDVKDATSILVINDLDNALHKQVFDVFQTL